MKDTFLKKPLKLILSLSRKESHPSIFFLRQVSVDEESLICPSLIVRKLWDIRELPNALDFKVGS